MCRPCGTLEGLDSFRRLKPTVNKVSSLRDLLLILVNFRWLKPAVNKVSSLRDVLQLIE